MLRTVENPHGRITLAGDLDFGCVEFAGSVFADMKKISKELIADDKKNPIPADDEIIIEKVYNGLGVMVGQVAMTYLQKIEIWIDLSQKQKELQARWVKPNNMVMNEINGVEYFGAVPGHSYAAKETAKNMKIAISNNKNMVRGGFMRPKKKRK